MKRFKEDLPNWILSIYKSIFGNSLPRKSTLSPKEYKIMSVPTEKKENRVCRPGYIKPPFVLLQDNLPGIYKYFGNDPKDRDKWARPETITCLTRLGKMASDAGFEIGVGDLSLESPGPFTNYYDKNKLDHRGHRNGNSIDIRPIRTDRKRLPVTWKHKLYDQETTDLLVRMAKECDFKLVLFCDPVIYEKYDYVKYYKGHSNHLHLRSV